MITRRIDGAVSRVLHAWSGGTLLHAALGLTRRSAALLAKLPRHGGGLAWLELRNKIAAYSLFEAGAHREGRGAMTTLDPYARLFAAEGYAYRNPRLDPQQLPSLSLIALHAGAGLRFAEQTLDAIGGAESHIRALVEYSDVCRAHADEGFRGIMEEALGLMARSLYPHLVASLDATLSTLNPDFRDRFWHGVGRAIYFTPANLPPFRAWSGVAACLTEPPHPAGRRNALSGFSFALALVNLQHPEILEAFCKYHAEHAPACLDGIQAAMAVWSASSGGADANGLGPPERWFAARHSLTTA